MDVKEPQTRSDKLRQEGSSPSNPKKRVASNSPVKKLLSSSGTPSKPKENSSSLPLAPPAKKAKTMNVSSGSGAGAMDLDMISYEYSQYSCWLDTSLEILYRLLKKDPMQFLKFANAVKPTTVLYAMVETLLCRRLAVGTDEAFWIAMDAGLKKSMEVAMSTISYAESLTTWQEKMRVARDKLRRELSAKSLVFQNNYEQGEALFVSGTCFLPKRLIDIKMYSRGS